MSDGDAQRILAAIERLEAGQGRLEATQDRLEAKQDRLETNQDRLEAKQDTMGSDIMARMDRLQQKVDQTHDDMIVNFGNTDRVERAARTAMDDNRTTSEIMRVMQRQIMRLQTDVEILKGLP